MSDQIIIAAIGGVVAIVLAVIHIREQRRNTRIAKIEEFAAALDIHFRSILDLSLRKANDAHDASGNRKNKKRFEEFFKSHSALKREVDAYIEKKLTRRWWFTWRMRRSKVERLRAVAKA